MKHTPKTRLLAQLMRTLNKAMLASQLENPKTANDYFDEKRRKFLTDGTKAAAAIGFAGLIGSCQKVMDSVPAYKLDGARKLANLKSSPRIAIIGAGIAGLYAAFLLKQKGIPSTVYEASSRTGGRMFTAKNIMGNGLTTELGGEFIDSIHKDMLTLAKTFNLELLDTQISNQSTLTDQAYFFNGVHYTEQQVIDAFLPFARIIQRDQQLMSGLISADSHSAFDAMIDNLSIAQYFDRIGLSGWLRSLMDVAYVTEFGLSIDEQTALNFLWMISPKVKDGSFEVFGVSDERYKIKGGNQQVCDKLAAQVQNQIKTENILTAIRQQNNGTYQLSFNTGSGTATETADIVLLTIPFTLLREVAIEPAFPAWKQQAIQNIGYGNNSKLMLGFQTKYWHSIGYAGYYFTDSFLQSGWDNSALQSPTAGGLTIYSGGQQALTVGNGSAQSQAQIHLPKIDEMFPGAVQQFSGLAERFVWPTYQWTKCSYTCFLPGQYTNIAGNEIKPIGNIFFAGEHCSYDYQGYMNGGAETGRRAAESILKML